jgi:hypothetical protein
MTPWQIASKGTEAAHQMAVFAWCALNQHKYPVLGTKCIFAVTNEEKCNSVVVGMKSKAMGRKAGVSDIILLASQGKWHGLCLEMKKPGGKISDEQHKFQAHVTEERFMYMVAYGWEEAVWIIKNYLEGTY